MPNIRQVMHNFAKSDDLIWTKHSLYKLKQYGLSASRIKRVFAHSERREVGVAANTIAAMQTAGSAKHRYEIWLMYQITNREREKIKILSVWKFPGISPVHEPPPIPEDDLKILAPAE